MAGDTMITSAGTMTRSAETAASQATTSRSPTPGAAAKSSEEYPVGMMTSKLPSPTGFQINPRGVRAREAALVGRPGQRRAGRTTTTIPGKKAPKAKRTCFGTTYLMRMPGIYVQNGRRSTMWLWECPGARCPSSCSRSGSNTRAITCCPRRAWRAHLKGA